MLPSVMFIDVRENTPLLCHDIMRFQPSKFITIISDCNYLTTRIPTHAITETSTTNEKKKRNIFNRSIVSKHIKKYYHWSRYTQWIKATNGTEMYIVTLILSLLLIPSTTIIIYSIIRCWKSRRCCQEELQLQRELCTLNPLNADSHEPCDD